MSSPAEPPSPSPGNANSLSQLFEAQSTIKELSEILKSLDATLDKLADVFDSTVKKRKKRVKNEMYFVESRPAAVLKFT